MSKSTSTIARDNKGEFTFDRISPHIDLPGDWVLVPYDYDETFAGYDIIGQIKAGDEGHGYLLADAEYQRIACALIPAGDDFFQNRMLASDEIDDGRDVEKAGEEIAHEVTLCHNKIEQSTSS